MITCTRCIINHNYPNIKFNDEGICSLCSHKDTFKPIGENKLIDIFNNAKKKNREYDALVPLSGGKDSVYILYLAVYVYKLRVLAMTYDNGFLSSIALDNIQQAIKKTNVKHIICKPQIDVQQKS